MSDELDEAARMIDEMEKVLVEVRPGVESIDARAWAAMLRRMYVRWAKRRGWTASISTSEDGPLDFMGDGVSGAFAVEDGVHRLVRISPFDACDRRHTSFALVVVDGVGSDGEVARSYVLDPYTRVKDHRRNLETDAAAAVLDGDLDLLIARGGE